MAQADVFFCKIFYLPEQLFAPADRLIYQKNKKSTRPQQLDDVIDSALREGRQDRKTRFGQVPDEWLCVETAGTFAQGADARLWRQQVQQAFPTMKVSYVHLPCSSACHVRINAAGAGIVKKELL